MRGRLVQRALQPVAALPLQRVFDDREVQNQLPDERHDDLLVAVDDVHRVCTHT